MPEKQLNTFEIIGSILISKEIIIAILGGIMGAVIAPWTKWHFRVKELVRADRKEKIVTWRNALNEFDKISNFHNHPVYNELITYVQDAEKNKILSDDSVHVNVFGDSTGVTETSDRVIALLYKVVSDLEKRWDLV